MFNFSKKFKLFFASDIHGSEKCFYKFINAAKFYNADVIVMGGDITGKAILFLEEVSKNVYTCKYVGNEYKFQKDTQEFRNFLKLVKGAGYYPYMAEKEEIDYYKKDTDKMNGLFDELMCSSLSDWMDVAEERLKPLGKRCFIMPGNDDPRIVEDVLNCSPFVINPENKVIEIDDYNEMVSLGWSNKTPWDSPRECTEEELSKRIEIMMSNVKNPEKCILCAHVPPYNTGLDEAPKLDNSLKVKSSMGQVEFAPAGSTAVLNAIKKYNYILSLHGHIHEVHAVKRIGRTVSINPGSDYGEGVLHGVLATFSKGKLLGYQLVSG